MESVLTTCCGCGTAVRIRSPEVPKRRFCPRCGTMLNAFVPRAEERKPAVAPDQQAEASAGAASARLPYLLTLLAVLVVWLGQSLVASNPSAMGRTASTIDAHSADSPSRPLGRVGGSLAPNRVPSLADALTTNALSFCKVSLGKGVDPADREPPDVRSLVTAIRGLASWIASGPSNPQAGVDLALSVLRGLGFNPTQPARADEVSASCDGLGAIPVLTPPDFGAPSLETLSAACRSKGVPHFSIRGDDGKTVVARLHGHRDGKTVVLLPDGRLGVLSMVVPTDAPFVPISADEMEKQAQRGRFAEFQVHRTPHYLILYKSSKAFAVNHGNLLEDLYRRLLEAFRRHDVPVHEADFPLVAVIFRSENDFREHRPVDPDVRAYYEIFSNRIFLFEHPEDEGAEPEIAALLTTQTVAHEGTHQIIHNIGVQPRLGAWPLWLVEGLAEYCAAPASSRKGPPTWDGLGHINSLHMATLRELDDPVSLTMNGSDERARLLTRKPGQPMIEALLRQKELTPTDYALAWAVTHYLAMKRGPEFTRFLTVMGQSPPLEPKSPDDHVRQFREAFGEDLARMDKTIDGYLRKLARQKGYDPLPYYAVMFEQPVPPGVLRRGAMVSQSPQVIQQWINELSRPGAGMPTWQAIPHPTRARATFAIQEWMRNY